MHRFLVSTPPVQGTQVTLPQSEAHHLARVLRLQPGAEVILFDGRGHEWLGRVAQAGRPAVIVEVIEPRESVPEPPVPVTVGLAILKGDQMDAAIRDATVLGATTIAPFVSAHVAVAERAWRARSTDRWERIAVAAAKQSARAVVPAVKPVARFDDLLSESEAGLRVLCVEPAQSHERRSEAPLPRPVDALVCIGPEGGWAAAEIALADRLGCRFLSLGPRTLRAEATPIAALSVLWTWWGWQLEK